MSLERALGSGALIAVLVGAMTASVAAQADSSTARRPVVPKALVEAGEYGENLYDAAKASDWTGARRRLTALEAAVKQVTVEKGTGGSEDSLERNLVALKYSVAGRQRRETLRLANQITQNVANLTARYAPRIPVQVTRLDFYGRELEIWSEAGDADRLRATAEGMRREWENVRPSVEGRDSAEARKFGALVTRVERARTPAAYRRLAEAELVEVDNLEKAFER